MIVPMTGNTISIQIVEDNLGNTQFTDKKYMFCTEITSDLTAIPTIPNSSETIFYISRLPNNVRSLTESPAPGIDSSHVLLGIKNGRYLIIPRTLYEMLKAEQKTMSKAQIDPQMDSLLQAKKTIEDQIDKLEQIATSARATETDMGIQLTNDIIDFQRNILFPCTDALQNIKDAIQALQDYSDYCNTNNVIDPNMRYVFEQLDKLKSAWAARLSYDIVSLVASRLNVSETYAEQMLNDPRVAYDPNNNFSTLMRQYVDAQFEGDDIKMQTVYNTINNSFMCSGNMEISNLAPEILNYFSENPLLAKKVVDLEESFTPNSEELQKVLEELRVNRIGETITLNK